MCIPSSGKRRADGLHRLRFGSRRARRHEAGDSTQVVYGRSVGTAYHWDGRRARARRICSICQYNCYVSYEEMSRTGSNGFVSPQPPCETDCKRRGCGLCASRANTPRSRGYSAYEGATKYDDCGSERCSRDGTVDASDYRLAGPNLYPPGQGWRSDCQ